MAVRSLPGMEAAFKPILFDGLDHGVDLLLVALWCMTINMLAPFFFILKNLIKNLE